MSNKFNAKLITDYIKANNLTVKEFCRQCGISTSSYYSVINGKDCYLRTLLKIVIKMKVTFYQLYE